MELGDTLRQGCSQRLDIFSTLASGRARIVTLDLTRCGLQRVPAQLAGLTQFRDLSLTSNTIKGGWERVPRPLQQLGLSGCCLRHVPAGLAALTQLTRLNLSFNRIEGGWEHAPVQLQELIKYNWCGLRQLPAQLAGRTNLRFLWQL